MSRGVARVDAEIKKSNEQNVLNEIKTPALVEGNQSRFFNNVLFGHSKTYTCNFTLKCPFRELKIQLSIQFLTKRNGHSNK